MPLKIYPYKQGSRSARTLSVQLRGALPRAAVRVLRDEAHSQWRPRASDLVLNWGNSQREQRMATLHPSQWLNHPEHVRWFSNKLNFFQHAERVVPDYLVPFTDDGTEAARWTQLGRMVLARTKLTGHSGDGIEIIQGSNMIHAPLYTQYIPKRREYRIHFFKQAGGYEFFTQQKRRRREVPDAEVNWTIRNHDNGFIYAIDHVDRIDDQHGIWDAIRTAAGGLDFGAVDIIEGNSKAGPFANRLVMLEVNTACGIESPTLSAWYTDNITRRFHEFRTN